MRVLLIILFLPGLFFSMEPEEFLKTGNDYYLQQKYSEAINEYSKLIENGFQGTSLFYNLGNAYFRTGQIGKSILYYEKALRLSPNDEDIKFNLKFLNAQITDKVESLPKFFLFEWLDTILSWFTSGHWIILTFILYILLFVILGIYLLSTNISYQRIAFISGTYLIMIFVIVLSLTISKVNQDINFNYGVITEPVINVKLTPEQGSKDAFVIHEGLKVLLEDEFINWTKIRLEDGKVGWISNNDVEKI